MAPANFHSGTGAGPAGPGEGLPTRFGAGSAAAAPSGSAAARAVEGEREAAGEQALLPLPEILEEPQAEPLPFSRAIGRMPVELDVVVPVREFRVRNVLTLEQGQVIESQWSQGDDVPLTAGEVRLAWTEFEVIEGQLAVRITRLP